MIKNLYDEVGKIIRRQSRAYWALQEEKGKGKGNTGKKGKKGNASENPYWDLMMQCNLLG